MIFLIEEGQLAHQGQIIYKTNDQAFDFLPPQIGNFTVLLGTINMDFIMYYGDIKRASQIWGHHPPQSAWIRERLHTPPILQGSLILLDRIREDVDSIQLEGSLQWKTYYDPQTHWVCIGSTKQEQDERAVEFATNIVAVVHRQQLKALWIKPLIQ